MERTEDFCFKSKYLRSNMNQLREKTRTKRTNVMSNNITY